jgi:hypothetical protein
MTPQPAGTIFGPDPVPGKVAVFGPDVSAHIAVTGLVYCTAVIFTTRSAVPAP